MFTARGIVETGKTYLNEIMSLKPNIPLAERMRPRNLDDMVGQRRLLAPGTAAQTGLSQDELLRGEPRALALARWRSFVRDTDLVCSWGVFGTGLLEAAGGHLPAERVDLRRIARAGVAARP